MGMTTIEVLNSGMQCLVEHLGIIEAEQFIAAVIREKFDYTKWQRDHFDAIPADVLHAAAIDYEEKKTVKNDAFKPVEVEAVEEIQKVEDTTNNTQD